MTMSRIGAALACALLGTFMATPLFAAPPSNSVCLSNTIKGGSENGRAFVIAVPSEKADELLKRGFKLTDCTGVRQDADNGNRQICAIAAQGNQGLRLYLWQRYSLTAAELCRVVQGSLFK